eukprot:scaffold14753_cov78-Skeletonema_marinoi.AAC.2
MALGTVGHSAGSRRFIWTVMKSTVKIDRVFVRGSTCFMRPILANPRQPESNGHFLLDTSTFQKPRAQAPAP